MKKKLKDTRKSFLMSFIAVFVMGWAATPVSALEQDGPFPAYGSGPVQVRMYADYFCPPCGQVEPMADPILKDLLKKNAIRLTMIDVPFSSNTALYAKYYLYALKARNEADHSLRVRHLLFETASGSDRVIDSEGMEKLYKAKNIPFTVFEAKPVLNRYNQFIQEDKIDTTPTCIIEKYGKKEKVVGKDEIVNALKKLQMP